MFALVGCRSYRLRERPSKKVKGGPKDATRYPWHLPNHPYLGARWFRAGREIVDPAEILRLTPFMSQHVVAEFLRAQGMEISDDLYRAAEADVLEKFKRLHPNPNDNE
jgi:hypothetical protein